MHSIVLEEHKWLFVLSCINVIGIMFPNFYIFKGKRFKCNFITKFEFSTTTAMQPKTQVTSILFDKWISHFIIFIQNSRGSLCPTNRHLPILDGHNLHAILNVVHKVMGARLDIITLPSRTNHALQLLDVSCFKSFKIAFGAYKMSKH